MKNDKGETWWEFNHISDGFDAKLTHPVAMSLEQNKGWSKSTWQTTEALLVNSIVTRI